MGMIYKRGKVFWRITAGPALIVTDLELVALDSMGAGDESEL
jgi:hypothetical protein